MECFEAALYAGADAVYLGGNMFGARAYARNFAENEIIRCIDMAHLFGSKVYLTVNTLVKNREMDKLYDYIRPLYEAGLDAVIVQDLGVISYISRNFKDLPIHASTQMAVTDSEGIEYVRGLGVNRVVPARELSLEELRRIHDETDMELECFIHGAMCYSYSGKCLFSSIVGGRSGNRGRCAQPCRLPYNGKYLLSARDMSTIEILPELIDAGITSFKIEGRMKSKEYVAGVTGIYRKYLDLILKDNGAPYRVSSDDLKRLGEIYTRSGQCSGYYHDRNGRKMITVNKPSYNTAPEEVLTKLYDEYTAYRDKPLADIRVEAFTGREFSMTVTCLDHTVIRTGDILEIAGKTPTDADNIKKHVSKINNTGLKLRRTDVLTDGRTFVPVSLINRIRREAVEELLQQIHAPFRRRSEPEASVNEDAGRNDARPGKPALNCMIDDLSLLDTVLLYGTVGTVTIGLNAVLIKMSEDNESNIVNEVIKIGSLIHDAGKKFMLSFASIARKGYYRRISASDILNSGNVDGVITDNYEGLFFLKDIGYKGTVVSDIHLYAMNNEAALILKNSGVDRITLPLELNLKELAALKSYGHELVIYGKLPMMISAQCTMNTEKGCIHDNGISTITDRYGNVFDCVRNCNECLNTILNCVPLFLRPDDIRVLEVICSYRIHFTTENRDEASRILDLYDGIMRGVNKEIPDIKHTLGHLKRGVE